MNADECGFETFQQFGGDNFSLGIHPQDNGQFILASSAVSAQWAGR